MSKVTQRQPTASPQPTRCRDCHHAILHQYGNDPLLAFCKLRPTIIGHLPFAVEVANFAWHCRHFLPTSDHNRRPLKLFRTREIRPACYVTAQTPPRT